MREQPQRFGKVRRSDRGFNPRSGFNWAGWQFDNSVTLAVADRE